MRSHVRTAPFVESAVGFDGFQVLVARKRNAVQGRHFVERPVLRAFHASAAVTEVVTSPHATWPGGHRTWPESGGSIPSAHGGVHELHPLRNTERMVYSAPALSVREST